MERGVLALSQTSLRCQIRRGLPAFTHHSANMMEMQVCTLINGSMVQTFHLQCMLRYNQRPTQLLMGGIQEKMISFDLVKGKETQVVDTGGTCAVLRYHGRYVGCGDTSGKIQLRDPHSLTLQHTLDTHSGKEEHTQYILSYLLAVKTWSGWVGNVGSVRYGVGILLSGWWVIPGVGLNL